MAATAPGHVGDPVTTVERKGEPLNSRVQRRFHPVLSISSRAWLIVDLPFPPRHDADFDPRILSRCGA